MEGLVKLNSLTHEPKYLETAASMAEFYKNFDTLPVDHTHGMLCNYVGLLLLYESTHDAKYLERVEGGYVYPTGGLLEKCRLKFDRDEGCALADWLRLNLELGRITGKAQYYAMAERNLHNALLRNQTPSGGFGHRWVSCDEAGVVGYASKFIEARWCCDFHGALAFLVLSRHAVVQTGSVTSFPLALDFTGTEANGVIASRILPGESKGEVLRQRIRLDNLPATVLRVRKPQWADSIKAMDEHGHEVSLIANGDFFATSNPYRRPPLYSQAACTRRIGIASGC